MAGGVLAGGRGPAHYRSTARSRIGASAEALFPSYQTREATEIERICREGSAGWNFFSPSYSRTVSVSEWTVLLLLVFSL